MCTSFIHEQLIQAQYQCSQCPNELTQNSRGDITASTLLVFCHIMKNEPANAGTVCNIHCYGIALTSCSNTWMFLMMSSASLRIKLSVRPKQLWPKECNIMWCARRTLREHKATKCKIILETHLLKNVNELFFLPRLIAICQVALLK